MTQTAALLSAIVVALLSCTAGCAGEDAEAREVAYPQPIGVTPPPRAVAASAPAAEQQAPVVETSQVDSSGAPGVATPSEEVVVGAAAGDGDEYADTDPAALTDFHATLEPYGTWNEDPTYGTVWVPSASVVGPDFAPYVTAGHWVYDDDYVWVSDYDWGWAPFHYGRWVYAGPVGWAWVPGRVYAGAWVSWRSGWGDWGYLGWAPLPPTWCWRRGVAVGVGFVPVAPYAFVASANVFSPVVRTRLVAGAQVGVVAAHTRPWVPAEPSVSGRALAHPTVSGPPPGALHLASAAVVHPSMADRGLIQARAFSRPSTAAPLGARVPASIAVRAPAAGWSHGVASAAGPTTPAWSSRVAVPAYAPPTSSSHFGGRLGGGFAGSAASAPPMRAPSYTVSSPAAARPYFGAPSYSSSVPSRAVASPSYHPPSVGAYGGYRGGSSYNVAPSSGVHVGSSSGSHFAASSGVHVGASGGGFHGGGGGGGFHGGGGGGHAGGGGHGGGGHR